MEEGGVGKNTGKPMVSSSSRGVNYSGPQGLARRPSRNAATTTFSMEVFDNEVVPSLDRNSSGRGVRQFKTSLLQRLERDDAPSVAARVKKTDAREIESFYKQYYEKYVKALDQGEKADRAQLGKAYQVAGVLFEVLCAVNKSEKAEEVPADIIASARDVEAKQVIYAPYNILPLDSAGESQCIMQFEENQQKSGELDLLDWLKAMFGFQASSGCLDIRFTDWFICLIACFTLCFQKDNVRNQREHLILQLAHPQARLMPKPEPSLLKPVLCRLPQGREEMQQRKLLYMGLYLLIWGEAANVRFIPECLCYIFHNMACELHSLLAGNVSIVTGENVKPSYGGDDEAFLCKVITPIYRVIDKVLLLQPHAHILKLDVLFLRISNDAYFNDQGNQEKQKREGPPLCLVQLR
ncbi:1,3-beta-glucan synthase subunit FKS1-like, domain-1 [Cynara cardunculus var. scolymus]|uniref:1,3-beta-glucan synthase subunit FKS1-like, domain-1 n=1 Tax=Cynara cardunculus var. scolymus TaxID=59895 RepID=A0A103XJX4_CYNCS|nr:1,3-beta-glucan synthase subunit FKS1-like, domain-1 [Cynara cardunculus var. scolymus]